MLELIDRIQLEELDSFDIWDDEWESVTETEQIDWSLIEDF
jgi:hypothetical protein